MADDTHSLSRRAFLAAAGGTAAIGAALAQSSNEQQGNIAVGDMALDEAYNVAGDLWIGPASARGDVEAQAGRVYLASDTDEEFYGDGGNWTGRGFKGPSVRAEELHNANVHVLDADASLQTALSDYAGEIIDLGGRTYTVSSLLDGFSDDTVIRNGTIKLADGSDSDLVKVASTVVGVTFRNIFFDFNGANNTGAPTNAAWATFKGDQQRLISCEFKNASGRSSGDHAVWIDSKQLYGTDNLIAPGNRENHVHISGSQARFPDNHLKTCNIVEWNGPDIIAPNNQLTDNNHPCYLASKIVDMTLSDCIIEDNNWGIYLSDAIDSFENVRITGKIQGNSNAGVKIPSGGATGGKVVVRATFKRNQLGANGSGAQVDIQDGDDVKIIADQMTNDPANDAAYGFQVGSGASDTVIGFHGLADSDFATGVYTDSGTRTRINGRGYQSATPGSGNTGDEWGGNEQLAQDEDVTVVDTSSTAPYAMYKADGAANWSQIA